MPEASEPQPRDLGHYTIDLPQARIVIAAGGVPAEDAFEIANRVSALFLACGYPAETSYEDAQAHLRAVLFPEPVRTVMAQPVMQPQQGQVGGYPQQQRPPVPQQKPVVQGEFCDRCGQPAHLEAAKTRQDGSSISASVVCLTCKDQNNGRTFDHRIRWVRQGEQPPVVFA